MLRIQCAYAHQPEKEYIFSVIFSELLGIPFTVEYKADVTGYILIPDSGNTIHINDAFFSRYPEPIAYLTTEAIPGEVVFSKNEFVPEADIPVLYGTGKVTLQKSNDSITINCNIDIPAGVFYMLTRWEEMVLPSRDKYGRFPASASLSYRFGFSGRPVVNEWIEMLWNMLVCCGIKQQRKEKKFEVVPTCDVDIIHYPADVLTLAGDLKNTGNPLNLIKRIYWTATGHNPYNCLNWMMDQSERQGAVTRFYFMANGTHPLDNTYRKDDPLFKKMLQEIVQRGHIIGIHPGFDTWLDPIEWKRQKQYLEDAVQHTIHECRQHYLRLQLPETALTWQANSIQTDSSLGFSETQGFRCGTGDEYTLFDFRNRQPLTVKERPLIIMDTTLHSYKYHREHVDKACTIIESYRNLCKKYRMPYTILFHNSSFDAIRWPGWKRVYESVFAY